MKVAVIGGGAAGFFGAIRIAEVNPDAEIILFEKSNKLLSKVRVSGGGRCNVTHACFDAKRLSSFYPRGEKALIGPFSRFQPSDTVKWFEEHGVKLKTEADGRMFPITDNSETIVNCLLGEAEKAGIKIKLGTTVKSIVPKENQWEIQFAEGFSSIFDKILISSGGSPKSEGFDWLRQLGHSIETPVPSLFTFNIDNKELHQLSGLSVSNVQIKLAGEKLFTEGPLLVTHWGMSGPAILKMSAWGARLLANKNYDFSFLVNWTLDKGEEEVRTELNDIKEAEARRSIPSCAMYQIPSRLWKYLLIKSSIDPEKKWADLSKKDLNKLVNELTAGEFKVKGKTTFKEEFVTCGGIKLSEVDFKTMESKIARGIYFSGEVLDIDGVTGGFNFQNAWTTSWIAGSSIGL